MLNTDFFQRGRGKIDVSLFESGAFVLPSFISWDKIRRRMIMSPDSRVRPGSYYIDVVLNNELTKMVRKYQMEVVVDIAQGG